MLAVVAATTAAAGLIVVASSVPGRRRTRRAGWALHGGARMILRACGAQITVRGKLRPGPSLVVGNHVSFLDVLVLAAAGPMRMVAKDEIAGWPLIGWLAGRTGTLFVARRRWRELPDTVAEITAALRSGHRVQVFPEGTTRCGASIDPFRRAAFQAAMDAAIVVSPVALAYRDANGSPSRSAPFVGADTLVATLLRIIRTPGLQIEVHHLPPIPAIPGTGMPAVDRRNLARLAENAVARDLGQPVIRRIRQGGPTPRAAAPFVPTAAPFGPTAAPFGPTAAPFVPTAAAS